MYKYIRTDDKNQKGKFFTKEELVKYILENYCNYEIEEYCADTSLQDIYNGVVSIDKIKENVAQACIDYARGYDIFIEVKTEAKQMTKDRFIELLRGLCEKEDLFIDEDGEINFYNGTVKAYLTAEGIE